MLKDNDPPVVLAKVDATEESDLASRYGVQGYPTLKIFRSGKEFEYKGPRDAPGIISYMQKQAGAASKSLKTVADAEDFTTHLKDDVVLVAFFDSDSDKGLANFRSLAGQLREEHVFGEVVSHEYAIPSPSFARINCAGLGFLHISVSRIKLLLSRNSMKSVLSMRASLA